MMVVLVVIVVVVVMVVVVLVVVLRLLLLLLLPLLVVVLAEVLCVIAVTKMPRLPIAASARWMRPPYVCGCWLRAAALRGCGVPGTFADGMACDMWCFQLPDRLV